MNIATSHQLPQFPRATPISKQAWDAKVAASRKAEEAAAAELSWMDSKVDSFQVWKANADWEIVAEAARLGGLVAVGGTVGVLVGLQSGSAIGLVAGVASGFVAGTLGALGVNLVAPPATGVPEYREPLFMV